MDLNDLKGMVILLALVALISAAAAIGMGSLQDNLDDVCGQVLGSDTYSYNTTRSGSATPCCPPNGSAACIKHNSTAYNITSAGVEGINNSTGFLDTIGTIAGVAVLIGLVVLAFQFGKR